MNVVQLLLDSRADVDSLTTDQVTPLMVAVFYDTEWDLLLTAGANVETRNSTGERALEIVQRLVPRMGYLEENSIAPSWLSPQGAVPYLMATNEGMSQSDWRKCLLLLEKLHSGWSIDLGATASTARQTRQQSSPASNSSSSRKAKDQTTPPPATASPHHKVRRLLYVKGLHLLTVDLFVARAALGRA